MLLQTSLEDEKWKEQEDYKDVVSALNNFEDKSKQLQEKKAKVFTQTVIDGFNKDFKKWIDSQLLLYWFFGAAAMGKIVAHLILGKSYLGHDVYESRDHRQTIDLMIF